MQRQLNCPNCGAPIDGHKCKYCGTVIFDFAQIKMGEPCWIALDAGDGFERLVHVTMKNIEATWDPYHSSDSFEYVDENSERIKYQQCVPSMTLRVEFDCFPDVQKDYEKAIMMMFKDKGWSD